MKAVKYFFGILTTIYKRRKDGDEVDLSEIDILVGCKRAFLCKQLISDFDFLRESQYVSFFIFHKETYMIFFDRGHSRKKVGT